MKKKADKRTNGLLLCADERYTHTHTHLIPFIVVYLSRNLLFTSLVKVMPRECVINSGLMGSDFF